MGLKVLLIPITSLFSAIKAMRLAAKDIKELGVMKPIMDRNDSWDSVLKLVGLDRVLEWSKRYAEEP
jgi:2-methylisocitrate lyase-like PEP mutase family enzyme